MILNTLMLMFGFAILAAFAAMIFCFAWETVMTVVRTWRDHHGRCPQCGKRWASYATAHREYMYSQAPRVVQGVCPSGHTGIVRGNRRMLDW